MTAIKSVQWKKEANNNLTLKVLIESGTVLGTPKALLYYKGSTAPDVSYLIDDCVTLNSEYQDTAAVFAVDDLISRKVEVRFTGGISEIQEAQPWT